MEEKLAQVTVSIEDQQAQGLKSQEQVLISEPHKAVMRYCIAGLSFVAELIHLWLLPAQYETFSGYGIVFLLIAMVHGLVGALLLFEPGRRIIACGIWFNFLVILLYVFTHSVGVPVGLAFVLLPVDVYGMLALLAELSVLVLLIVLRRDVLAR